MSACPTTRKSSVDPHRRIFAATRGRLFSARAGPDGLGRGLAGSAVPTLAHRRAFRRRHAEGRPGHVDARLEEEGTAHAARLRELSAAAAVGAPVGAPGHGVLEAAHAAFTIVKSGMARRSRPTSPTPLIIARDRRVDRAAVCKSSGASNTLRSWPPQLNQRYSRPSRR